jgi:hypothetical protein
MYRAGKDVCVSNTDSNFARHRSASVLWTVISKAIDKAICPRPVCRPRRPCSITHLASCSCVVCLLSQQFSVGGTVGTEENCDLHQDSQCSGASFEIRWFRIQWNAIIHNTTTACNPCSIFNSNLTYPNRLPVAVLFPKRRFSTILPCVLFISPCELLLLQIW